MADARIQLVRSGDRFEPKLVQAERPEPRAGEVLMRVRAAALNKRDVSVREGRYSAGGADGFTPLSDAAGDIVAVGAGVSAIAVGDRVASTFFQNWPDGRIDGAARLSALGAGGPGVLAEHVVLSAGGVAPIPDAWSYEEGATLPCAGVTAWAGLVTHGRMQTDDWVLIMGTGGVALFGLQIAASFGARTVVISSSNDKLLKARALGATATVNYATTPDWQVAVREATGGEGVQQVLELGGAGTLSKSLASLAVGGHVAIIGALTGFGGDIPAAGLIMGAQKVSAVTVGSRADQLALTTFLESRKLRPIIDSVYALDDLEAAYARMAEGPFGKVVVKL